MKGLILAVVGAAVVATASSALAAGTPGTDSMRASRMDLLSRRSGVTTVRPDEAGSVNLPRATRTPVMGTPVVEEGLPELDADGVTLVLGSLVVEAQRVTLDGKPLHPRPRFVLDRIALEGPELAEIRDAKTPTSTPQVDRIGSLQKD
jgi:hypothetical protein